jgi:hypothetical protein
MTVTIDGGERGLSSFAIYKLEKEGELEGNQWTPHHPPIAEKTLRILKNSKNIDGFKFNTDARFCITSKREALLSLTEVTQENVTEWANAFTKAVMEDIVKEDDIEFLVAHFEHHCKTNDIAFPFL